MSTPHDPEGLIRAARRFYQVAESDCYEPADPLGPDAEYRVAAFAVELTYALEVVEESELPVMLGKAVRRLRDAFSSIIGRFGWNAILLSNRDEWFVDRCERFDNEMFIPYFRAVRTLCEAPESDHVQNLSFDYQTAIRRELPPADITPEQAAADIPSLRGRAKTGPIFGGRWPEAGPTEYSELLAAIRAVDLEYQAMPVSKGMPCKEGPTSGEPMSQLMLYYQHFEDIHHIAADHARVVESDPNFPRIRDLSCRLFGHSDFDPKTWKRLVDWLANQHDYDLLGHAVVNGQRAQNQDERSKILRTTPTGKVVELLRAAVEAESQNVPSIAINDQHTVGQTPVGSGPSSSTGCVEAATVERKRGQKLTKPEEKTYRKVIAIYKNLKLIHCANGNPEKVVEECRSKKIPITKGKWKKIRDWGYKKGLL